MLWLIIGLTLAGLTLLAAEVLLPGFIAGAIGIVLLLVAIIFSFTEYGVQVGMFMLIGILIVTFSGFMLWLYYFPRTFIGKRLMLNTVIDGPKEYPNHSALLGKEGVTLTDLRPSGAARIENQRVDVVAESGYIPAQEPVIVRKVEGLRVVVRRISAST
jgi:membrane-bound serine protease (ClpP class)